MEQYSVMDDDFFDTFIPITKKRSSRISCSQSTFSSKLDKQKTLHSFLRPRSPQMPSVIEIPNIISNERPGTLRKEVYDQIPKVINHNLSHLDSDTICSQSVSRKVVSSQHVSQSVPTDLIDYCPTCQVPFKSLNVQPHVHAVTCKMSWPEIEECSLGENCNISNIFHFRDYSHQKLAQLRASKRPREEDACENNDIETVKMCIPNTIIACNDFNSNTQESVFELSPKRKYNVGPHPLQHIENKIENQLLKDKNNAKSELTFGNPIKKESTCILNDYKDTCISPINILDRLTVSNISSISTTSTDFHIEQALNFNHQPDLFESQTNNRLLNVPNTLSFKGNIIYKEQEMNNGTKAQQKSCVKPNIVSCAECVCTKSVAKNVFKMPEELETSVEMTLTPPSKDTIPELTSPVKVQLQYNQLGWQTLGIDLQPEVDVEEIILSVCDSSHCMQVECTVTDTHNSKLKESKTNADGLQSKIFLKLDDRGSQNKNEYRTINDISGLLNREMSILSRFNSNGGSSTALALSTSNVTAETGVCRPTIVDSDTVSISSVNSVDIKEETDKANDLYIKNEEAKQKWRKIMVGMKRKGFSTMSVTSDDSLNVPPGKHVHNLQSHYRSKKCPFYKQIPDTSFVVDAFQYGIIPGVTHYFLTHFHADHYGGLRKSFNKPIICSAITASLVRKKLGIDIRYLNVIELENPRVIRNVTVTALDANHCPGSVMFLFQLMDGRNFLHVGDFRADPSMESFPCFWNLNIDKLFLDTTYCNPRYTFPTQVETISKVVDITKRHIKRHPLTLIVSGTYTIGKEKVFMGIAEALDCSVWADTEKRKVLECLRDPSLKARLVDNPWEARVHVWSMMDLNPISLQRHVNQCRGKFKEVLAFKPSGWELRGNGEVDDFKFHTTNNVTICCVPYSEHSSFTELRRFVKFLKPVEIVPTVNVRTEASRKTMQKYFQKWLSEPQFRSHPIYQQQKLPYVIKKKAITNIIPNDTIF